MVLLIDNKWTHSVLNILLPSIWSSIFRWLTPFPLVFLPESVSPRPLKLSHSSPPFDKATLPVDVPANAPESAEFGRDDPGVEDSKPLVENSGDVPDQSLGFCDQIFQG